MNVFPKQPEQKIQFCILHSKRAAQSSPFCLSSSSASATLVGILAHTGELAVGFGHECLQLLFKQLVCSFGSGGLDGCALGTIIPVLEIAAFPTLEAFTVFALEIAAFPALEAFALTALETFAFPALEITAFPTLEVSALTALEIAVALSLGLGLQTLDGQVDFAVFGADDHDLYILAFGQMLADIADICVGYLGNMYHAGLVFRQGDKCAEVGDGFDFTF